ncbi:MAG: AarF/ABC1/UbiB kinase family protein, partial [Elusimicrobia bacterium]|nr:AarF/ABC1/UbiB kinase family protein [Elusimicrobiota bacterium]
FLESLGLVGVKLGQVIAGSPATSAIMKEELKKLKDRARPINKGIVFDTIAKLYGSFGAKFTEVLELLGSASIKVVYRARLEDGREVVIKIKRPDVEKRIQEDLQFLRDVLGDVRPDLEAAGINLPRRLMATIEAIILEELNFDQEKSNQERLKKNVTGFRPIAWVLGFVFNLLIGSVIPAVRGRYRFAVPLALEVKENALMIEEFVSGTSLAAADKLAAQGANVTDLENAAAREFLRQLFVDGFYHADPHAGNLLVSAERGVIYLIDVGAAATISLLGRIRLVRLIRAVAKGNLAGVERFVRALRGEVTPPLRAKIQAALGSNASLATKIVLIFQALDDAGVNLPREMLAVFRFMGAGGELFEGRPTSPQGPSGPSLGRRVLVGVLVVAGIAAAAALTLAAISFAGAAIATAGVAPGAGMSLAGVLLFGLTLNFSETGENGPRRSDDREESARRLADVIVNVASGRSADAIANLQALGSLSIGNLGRGDPTGPFVEQWSRFAQDPAFMALVRAQIGDRLSGLSITEEDLAAVILNALGLGAQAPELLRAGPNAAAPRVFVTRGREAPGVMLAALLKTGLNNETILWVEPGTEAHYSAIANAANRLGGKVTIRPYASGADAGLDGDVFRPERVPTASLPTGVAADAVVFILSDGLRTDGIRANVLLLEQLLPMVDRQRIDAVVKAARLVLINA